MSDATARTLLPTGVTALERAVDLSAPRWDAITALPGTDPAAAPAPFAPWLAAEWGVAGFAPYFGGTAALLAATLPWLRERGTAAAVRRALAWLGHTHVKIIDDGPWLHIDPGRRVTEADLRAMAHVVRASIPAHVSFYRVFHGLDGRAIRFDGGPRTDGGLYDTDTGAPIDVAPWGGPVKLSQGLVNVRGTRPPGHRASRRIPTAHITHLMRRSDVPRYDGWRLDSGGTHGSRRTGHLLRLRLAPGYAQAPAHVGALAGFRVTAAPARAEGRPLRQPTATAIHTCSPIQAPPRTWDGGWDDEPWQQHIHHKLTQEP